MPPSIYLDNNATTPVLPEVVAAMAPFWSEHFANPSSVHQPGQHARAALELAREQVATLLGCAPAEIIFTSGGTESNNLALSGVLQQLLADRLASGQTARPHLITSAIEHDAVLRPAQALADRNLIDLTILPCTPSGLITPDSLAAAFTANTCLVSLMLANNETGVLQPIAELTKLAHRAGALIHTDAVQAAGKLPLRVRDLGVDLLTLSGHKLHGPKGTGALYLRRSTALAALHHGGPQERQRRAGTENVAALVGFGHAAALAHTWLQTNGPTHLAVLRDHLEQAVCAALPTTRTNGLPNARIPNTSNFLFPGVRAEDLMIALDLQGLSVSAGSACQSGALEPSHVLRAMGLTDADARASLRLSLSRLTTPDEVDRTIHLLTTTVPRLRP